MCWMRLPVWWMLFPPLVDAILAHYSEPSAAHGNTPAYPASEANQVIRNFANLHPRRQQDVINFLRAL